MRLILNQLNILTVIRRNDKTSKIHMDMSRPTSIQSIMQEQSNSDKIFVNVLEATFRTYIHGDKKGEEGRGTLHGFFVLF